MDTTTLGIHIPDADSSLSGGGLIQQLRQEANDIDALLVGRFGSAHSSAEYASLAAAVTAIGSTVTDLIISTANYPTGGNVTVPITLQLIFRGAGTLLLGTGNTVTILSSADWPVQKIFANALAAQGTIDFTGNRSLQTVYPEWWGASPSASASINTPAIQAAIVAAYGATLTITGATNANPVQFTYSPSSQLPNGIYISLDGATGAWASPVNFHVLQATVTGANTFTVGINSTALGALSGTIHAATRSNGSGGWNYNRVLHFSGIYEINDELKVYHMIGFQWTGENKFNSGIRQTVANKRIIDGQSLAYGVFSNLIFQGAVSSNLSLLDIDYDGSQGSDLRPQNITFQDCVIQNNAYVGSFATGYIGVHIAKAGTGAQGDNIRFYNCYINGFQQAGLQIGGGVNGVLGNAAQNAIEIEWNGGDIQGCRKYGIAVYGGGINVKNASFENGQVTSTDGVSQIGYDLFSTSNAYANTAENIRSESCRFAVGAWNIKNCSVLGPQITLNDPWANLVGTTSYVNQLVTGTPYGGDGKVYLVSNVGVYGGLTTTTATGGSLTTVVKTGAGWAVNAFVGQRVTIMTGAGKYQYGVITGNTATTLTCAAGFVSDFLIRADTGLPVIITTPDATSTFLIEPNWSAGPTSSGTVNFAVLNVFSLGDPSLPELFQGNLENFGAGVGTQAYLNNVQMNNVSFTRSDWFTSNTNALDTTYSGVRFDRVTVQRWRAGLDEYVPWTVPRNGIPGFRDYSWTQRNAQWIVWSCGDTGGGASWLDLGIGRGDGVNFFDGNVTSRNVLGYLGMLGRKTPAGTDQAGAATQLQGGLSRGSGAPGAIEFWLGAAGASGSQVNAGTKAMSLDTSGLHIPVFTFATLPAGAANGTVIYVSDGLAASTPLAGASTGTLAIRANGAWRGL